MDEDPKTTLVMTTKIAVYNEGAAVYVETDEDGDGLTISQADDVVSMTWETTAALMSALNLVWAKHGPRSDA